MKLCELPWTAAHQPVPASAVLAQGEAARQALSILLRRNEDRLTRKLQGIYHQWGIILVGSKHELPWYDGVEYFGKPHAQLQHYYPCTLVPPVPIDVIDRALSRQFDGPVLYRPRQKMVYPLACLRALEKPKLQQLAASATHAWV